jgi:acetyl-CoA carboxylase carboxyl transferase subunit alpha
MMARQLGRALADALRQVSGLSTEQLLAQRMERLLAYGRYQEVRA